MNHPFAAVSSLCWSIAVLPFPANPYRSVRSPALAVARERRGVRGGFSLIELMVVMTIIITVGAMSMPLTSSLISSNKVERSLRILSGTLEQARQYALARNTYVWVAFTDSTPGDPKSGPTMVVLEARDGVDALNWSTVPVSLAGNADIAMVGMMQQLTSVQLTDAGKLAVTGMPAITGTLKSLQPVNLTMPRPGGASLTFTRAIQFTPDGQARVQFYTTAIELGLQPAAIKANAPQSGNVAVLRLGTYTGKLQVYRPN
jgi:type II secretory pathway pseudopilin PulG